MKAKSRKDKVKRAYKQIKKEKKCNKNEAIEEFKKTLIINPKEKIKKDEPPDLEMQENNEPSEVKNNTGSPSQETQCL